MAFTPSLPWGTDYEPITPPLQTATRRIPANGNQPNFGLMLTMTPAGSVVKPNRFYDASMQYYNMAAFPQVPVNMIQNRYLGMIPGIMKSPIPAGGQG